MYLVYTMYLVYIQWIALKHAFKKTKKKYIDLSIDNLSRQKFCLRFLNLEEHHIID